MIKTKFFLNKGWLVINLSDKALNYLNKIIKNRKENHNNELAGNINESCVLKDEDNWFFKNVLVGCMTEYVKEFGETGSIPNILTKNCKYTLDSMWVNYQKKYEFNPLHNHGGVFSFVIWIQIPTSYKKESNLKFVKHASYKPVASFQFVGVNMLGQITRHDYNLEPEDEGTMLFFPSQLHHQVYPFYTSNKKRITISGNLKLNPEEIYSLKK
jgi:hypothetical protein